MAGKRIVMCTFGSLGDIHPFLAVARELKHRGHFPVIATTPYYQARIESAGIAFRPIRPDIDVTDPVILRRVMDPRTGGRYTICEILFPALRRSYEDTAAAAAGADLLVIHPVAFSAFLYARKSGLPWASVALAPISLYSIYDPPVFSGFPFARKLASLRPSVQKHLRKALAFMWERDWKPFRLFERELGLSHAPNPLFWGHSPHLALGLFSPLLAAPQPDWPSSAHATGFPFLDPGRTVSAELQQFLDSGPPPIVFTLGSAAVGAAGDFFRQSAEAARRLGRRAVLLAGRQAWNQGAQRRPRDLLVVPYAPHSALFPKARVVVHQGGIGTTAEAMRAGRPMLVVPYCHDQPDQAARLTRIGVARSIPREHYDSRIAAAEIQELLEGSTYAVRAADVAFRVRRENGTSAACDHLCRLLETSRPEREYLSQLARVVA